MPNDDVIWFRQRAKRQCRIRLPAGTEFASAWRYLGDHNADRRRVLIWRIPLGEPGRNMFADGLMRIPFLALADETIEDDDDVLLKILDEIMRDAAKQESVQGFIRTGGGTVPVQ